MRWLVVALVVASCASPKPVCVLPAVRAGGAPYVWKVTKSGQPGTMWLFGTIHIAGEKDVAPSVIALLESSTKFASELGDVEPDEKRLLELARAHRNEPLSEILPRDDWWTLEDAMRSNMKSDELKWVRPWFAMIRFMSVVAPAPKPSMDVALTDRASRKHLPIDALESWDEQMTALDKSVTPKDLSDLIHERRTLACSQEQLHIAYLVRDTATLEKVLAGRDPLLRDRNRMWLPKLEGYVTSAGTTFVAVGLGHMLGPDSVVAMLKAEGFDVVERDRP